MSWTNLSIGMLLLNNAIWLVKNSHNNLQHPIRVHYFSYAKFAYDIGSRLFHSKNSNSNKIVSKMPKKDSNADLWFRKQSLRQLSHGRQCDQIALWATFLNLWHKSFFPKLPHCRQFFKGVQIFQFSCEISFGPLFIDIWLLFIGHAGPQPKSEKTFLWATFYRHLATFYWSRWLTAQIRKNFSFWGRSGPRSWVVEVEKSTASRVGKNRREVRV